MFDAHSTKHAIPLLCTTSKAIPSSNSMLSCVKIKFTDDLELLRSVLRKDELVSCSMSQLSSESGEL